MIVDLVESPALDYAERGIIAERVMASPLAPLKAHYFLHAFGMGSTVISVQLTICIDVFTVFQALRRSCLSYL